ncbi:MAG: MBL fold metallo-hydrolase [Deltaproteobacteria bacterium]|nr:MBL fold metallo-hydrolase [Deltaproteobacteria bacterium]
MAEIQTFQLGPLETNAYLILNDGRAVVIDPGGEPEVLVEALGNTVLEAIVNTHLHFDHIQGNAGLQRATKAPILASNDDADLLESELGGGGLWGLPRTEPFAFEPLNAGTWNWAGLDCRVMHTPGHSSGSHSLYFPELKAVFCGDLLFYRSVGRTDFPGGSLNVLERSVRENIFTLPEDTVIYPGHGPETSVGDEMRHNPFLSDFRP